MTEQEAINVLLENVPKCCKMVDGRYQGGLDDWDCEMGQAIRIAILALQDVQNYQKIGTVEECLKAMVKQKAMKPKEILRHRGGFEIQHCPNCNMDYQVDRRYEITDGYCPVCGKLLDSVFKNYCANCGQAIENENLEEMENE